MNAVTSDSVSFNIPTRRIGASRLSFRDTGQAPDDGGVVILGDDETFGFCMEETYAGMLAQKTGEPVLNLGSRCAGVATFLHDPEIPPLCQRARAVVIQLPSVLFSSNRFYRVHRLRNDRFLQARPELERLFPKFDFAGYSFVRRLVHDLASASPESFGLMREGLREDWANALAALIERVARPVVLLRMAGFPAASSRADDPLEFGPALLDEATLAKVGTLAEATLDILVDAEEIAAGQARMRFGLYQEPAARALLGPVAHARAADALANVLEGIG